jgi:coenzyme F420-reducing hydrogenase beta subunit
MPTPTGSAKLDRLIEKTRVYYCLECGKCTALCPIARVNREYAPVMHLARALRGFHGEARSDQGIWACMTCEICSTACPSQVDYPRFVLGLRAEVLRSGFENTHLSDLEGVFLEGERDPDLGVYRRITAIRTAMPGQDGGVVTSILVEGLASGLFDCAIVVQRRGGSTVEAVIAESAEEIRMSKGSKYQLVPVAGKLVEAALERGKKRIAVVGTPCQVAGIREIQQCLPEVEIFVIGLFCMENFNPHLLRRRVAELLEVDLDTAEATGLVKGSFTVTSQGRQTSCSVSDLQEAVREVCRYCTDFTARLADISIGSIGSPQGFSTVITRSRKGDALLSLLQDSTEAEVDRAEIARLASRKRKKGTEKLQTEFPVAGEGGE